MAWGDDDHGEGNESFIDDSAEEDHKQQRRGADDSVYNAGSRTNHAAHSLSGARRDTAMAPSTTVSSAAAGDADPSASAAQIAVLFLAHKVAEEVGHEHKVRFSKQVSAAAPLPPRCHPCHFPR